MLFLASLPGTEEAKSSHMEYFGPDRAGPPQLPICRMRVLRICGVSGALMRGVRDSHVSLQNMCQATSTTASQIIKAYRSPRYCSPSGLLTMEKGFSQNATIGTQVVLYFQEERSGTKYFIISQRSEEISSKFLRIPRNTPAAKQLRVLYQPREL